MKRDFCSLVMSFVFLLLPHFTYAVKWDPKKIPEIKVLIQVHNQNEDLIFKGFDLRVNQQRLIWDLESHLPRWQKLRFSYDSQNKIWRVYQEEKLLREISASHIVIEGEQELFVNQTRVPATLNITAEREKLYLVYHEDIDSYLQGVIPSEMPASWPLEALKAQVVASRTYAYFQARHHKNRVYHVEANTNDQVFQVGLGLSAQYQQKVTEAILSTKGMVLVQNDQVLKAYYHADCGGQTEEPEYVWQEGEGADSQKMGSVKDSSCPLSPHGLWSYSLSTDLLKKKLQEGLKVKKASPSLYGPLHFKIVQHTPSGRVSDLEYETDGKTYKVSAQDLRSFLGFNLLKSTKFKMSVDNEKVVFWGRGHGHGVGLCQWGSRYLAKRGLPFQKILSHYYSRALIQKWKRQKDSSQVAQFKTQESLSSVY